MSASLEGDGTGRVQPLSLPKQKVPKFLMLGNFLTSLLEHGILTPVCRLTRMSDLQLLWPGSFRDAAHLPWEFSGLSDCTQPQLPAYNNPGSWFKSECIV